MKVRRVPVDLPATAGCRYEVTIGADCLTSELARWGRARAVVRVAVVSDEAVAAGPGRAAREALAAGGADVIDLRIPSGERNKTRATVERIQDAAIEAGLRRDGLVVAVGGGVAGDVAGFVAATLFRGIDYVQVPTTLLAMVDAAVGGKTGVDTPAGKNLVGAFHQPLAVIADVSTLESLPLKHVRAGLAEVIKYGVILDEQLFIDLEDGLLESCLARVPEAVIHVVEQCVKLKAAVVAEDELESGRRQILNFGHTVGHAVEALSDYGILHGEAVAIGMIAEANLARTRAGSEPDLPDRIADLCARAGLPVQVPASMAADGLLEMMQRDKKVRDGKVRCALPIRVGAMAGEDEGWSIAVTASDLRSALPGG